jgi:hypothetical protein
VTSFSKHPISDLHDQARILGDREDFIGR